MLQMHGETRPDPLHPIRWAGGGGGLSSSFRAAHPKSRGVGFDSFLWLSREPNSEFLFVVLTNKKIRTLTAGYYYCSSLLNVKLVGRVFHSWSSWVVTHGLYPPRHWCFLTSTRQFTLNEFAFWPWHPQILVTHINPLWHSGTTGHYVWVDSCTKCLHTAILPWL